MTYFLIFLFSFDYWNTTPKQKEISPVQQEKKFDWSKYLAPTSKEFFKEGQHIPPEPFMEVARNPTDENIKNWFAVIDAKNQIMQRLQENMNAYLAKNTKSISADEKTLVIQEAKKLDVPKVLDGDIKRFRFQLYFESSCPHCHMMLETIKELQQFGYYVEVKQIDKSRIKKPLAFALVSTNAQELKQKQITSWPVLFIADTKKEVVYRINGYFPTSEIIKTLSNKERL